VFRHRDFVLLWLAQLVSTAGSALTNLAAAIYVYDKTGSALLVGLTLIATSVPSMVVGLLAGVFVDRFERRSIMLASNLAQAVIVAGIPFLLGIDIAFLFAAILANAAVQQFFDPAYESIIPELATDEELTAANAYLQVASFGSNAIGFAGAGLLASAFDINWAFWLDSLTFVFSAGCIWLLRLRSKPVVEEETSVGVVFSNLRTGGRALRDTPILRTLLLIGIPAWISTGLWNVLLLPMAIRELHTSEFEYGIQEGLTSVGFIVGSLLVARYSDRVSAGTWAIVGACGQALAGVLYGLSPVFSIAIVWVTISGIFNSPFAVGRSTLLQRNTPRELRGRVFATFFVIRDTTFLLGMAGAGLADVLPVRGLLIASQLILVLVAVVMARTPGIGLPTAGWSRGLAALRAARPAAAGVVRNATTADLDTLIGRLATFAYLSDAQRTAFLRRARIREVSAGTRLVTTGEQASAAFFILEGETAAAIPEPDGSYRGLSTMGAGDFFGEIAALTGSPRTADVVATEPSVVMEVPADALRGIMDVPEVNRLLLSTLTERLLRTNHPDLPRLAAMDQSALRALRTRQPTVEALPKTYAEA